MSLLAILALPLVAATLCAVSSWRRIAPLLTVASSLLVLVLAVFVAMETAAGNTVTAFADFVAVDALSALIVLLIALVGTTAAIYSWGYMARSSARAPARLSVYYANYNLFIFSMLAIPIVVEPTLVWIFVELTTLSSAMLVSFEDTRAALEAAWKYVALSLMGAAIALLGFLLLFAAMQTGGGGTYTWDGLRAAAPHMPPALLQTAFLLILVGFGTKVGLVPLHTWLPDAHSQAPSPVCALLSGIETTSVLYVVLRLLPILKAASMPHVETWAIVFGLISVGTAAFLLLQVRDYKRMFAYSTVEHMGLILVAAGLASPAAHFGAMYQVLTHTATKSFCFFAAGTVVLTVTTRKIASVRGLVRTSPIAAASLLLGGLAIAGAPPLAVFLSEFSILRAGFAEGRYAVVALLAVFIAIGFVGVLLHINRMVFGRPQPPTSNIALPRSCTMIVIVAGALVVALGLYLPAPLADLLRLAAASLQG
jgi:hydrogenase-4 component F